MPDHELNETLRPKPLAINVCCLKNLDHYPLSFFNLYNNFIIIALFTLSSFRKLRPPSSSGLQTFLSQKTVIILHILASQDQRKFLRKPSHFLTKTFGHNNFKPRDIKNLTNLKMHLPY